MQFAIDSKPVRLTDVNPRVEKHGDEDRHAIDLKLVWTAANDELAQFHPKLRGSLYGVNDAPGKSSQPLAGVDEALAQLLFPNMGPLKWSDVAGPMDMTVHYGVSGAADIQLHEVTVDKFVIEPLQGGSVKITLRARCICEDEAKLGKLNMLLHCEVPVTIKSAPVNERVAAQSVILMDQAKKAKK